MTTKNITIYVAKDGKEFKTFEECVTYENKSNKFNSLRESLITLRDFCEHCNDCKRDCPFFDDYECECSFSDGYPDQWKI